jgi:predicted nucleic acid-binding protein
VGTVFVDASAGVKRYVDEVGSDLVAGLDDLAVSALTRVEIPSALWRKQREGRLSVDQVAVLLEAFEVDWHGTATEEPRFAVVAAGPEVLVLAAELLGRHDLRAGDAVQLASALTVEDLSPEPVAFACFDARLREAAAREGFRLLPVGGGR